ncbi:RagB/SusD family nutrient uptake outer membrane protein [Carboxylicivirga sp. A043]|uniref:RagB/SusD family nutrient uptake outer membrane protein n=1 Tax=Carboxylicivirga litoralis TaxID=2816963 RepID=UPI0021CB90B2|nr:RagB/SusD family nutrient uptake outer membrane protein [Carboxylicivirga sp. A043]MCU4155855.1 RagB/SusD family nutrient uptake outer membrane protein [Carboxylicivirga sp. A043]
MKKLLYIAFVLLPLIGCNDFLDEVDQDKIIPETTDHFAALLLKEFNYSSSTIYRYANYMTDDLAERDGADAFDTKKKGWKTFYTWQQELEINEEGDILSSANKAWETIYEDIAIANYVIELIEDATGDIEEVNYVKGEAYFIRAYSYFNLLNLYGVPYNASSDSDLGVPLRLDTGVETTYRRNSVNECYAQIEADIEEAMKLIDESGLTKTKWHPNIAACNLLMSRVKLYQEKWNEAIAYADKVIENYGLTVMDPNTPFVVADNNEILYSFQTANISGWGTNSAKYFAVTDELYDSFDDADRRKEMFFAKLTAETNEQYIWTNKYNTTFTGMGWAHFRVAEAFLNRAEAYAQSNSAALALADIQTLHSYRYSNTSSIVYPENDSEVLSFVLDERRKELCFEEHHRWFDLRRMDERPEITHVYSVIDETGVLLQTETYTLFSDDPNYTLPLPLEERENNLIIRNVERYAKFPEIDTEINI